jgi:hypothetical protein
MTEKELRINNLVIADDFICKIVEIKSNVRTYFEPENYIVSVLEKGTNKEFSGFIERLKGIELNEEWLVKAGLEKKSEEVYRLDTGAFEFEWIVGEGMYFEGVGIDIDYVHDLQNLYFAVRKEELVFKL